MTISAFKNDPDEEHDSSESFVKLGKLESMVVQAVTPSNRPLGMPVRDSVSICSEKNCEMVWNNTLISTPPDTMGTRNNVDPCLPVSPRNS